MDSLAIFGFMEKTSFILICFSSLLLSVYGACNRVEFCNREHKLGFDAIGPTPKDSTIVSCVEFRQYSNCLAKGAKSCLGDLGFHSSTSLMELIMKRYNCSQYNYSDVARRPAKAKRPQVCSYTARKTYQHCGLFGDPHLKTFSRNYETCKTSGAWPLIANKYLAVQVTNFPVVNSSTATAIAKITVIIKQSTTCAALKTYEATADSQLPNYFIDGTNSTGPEGSVTIKSEIFEDNEKVEIYLRYIDTTLVIRRVGKYLAFSCKLPKEIVNSGNGKVELCRNGCPRNEVMNIETEIGHNHSADWKNAYEKCTEIRTLGNKFDGESIKNTLTDYYLDWCIFDVLTSRQTEFIAAAYSAQEDTMQMDPTSLQNRTVPLGLTEADIAAAASNKYTVSCIFILVLLLFNL